MAHTWLRSAFWILLIGLMMPARVVAESGEGVGGHADLNILWVIPFALMLLSIAVLPLVAHHWWESNRNKFYISLVLGLPVLVYFMFFFPHGTHNLAHTGLEYFSFIVLLGALFIISGGIFVGGDIRATPLVNAGFMLLGSVLASFMGTTGASMVLIRPLLKTNSERKHVVHTVVFFIFLVGNIGGLLTPLGDPPLFMGYLFGVPFSWTFGLWGEWAFAVGVLLAMYFIYDSIMFTKERPEAIRRDIERITPLHIEGTFNFLLLGGVVCTVAFVTQAPYREIILILLTIISLIATKKAVRKKNEFNYHPIIEVAVLFFGIFLTMIPAIHLLNTRGQELGVTEPWQFFWATGSLSAFLDNTPTYVTFFALAQGLGLENEIVGMPVSLLSAISVAAVFFGAVTYIGNAPNFMIKAIAEHRKVRMPSFFGFMVYSLIFLIPLFVAVTFIWFRP